MLRFAQHDRGCSKVCGPLGTTWQLGEDVILNEVKNLIESA